MKFSVIVPVYNVEKYLNECIDSILNQTMIHDEYEIIIVNDGSTDNSLNIAEKYKKKYNNIKLINQKNQGLSEARNTGIREACGEYIYFLDSDDMLAEHNMLDECYKILKNNNLQILMFDAQTLCESEQLYQRANNLNKILDRKEIIESSIIQKGTEFLNKYYDKKGYFASVWLYAISRKFIMENNLFFAKGLIHEDEEYTFKCLLLAERIEYIQNKYLIYRIREDSITNRKYSVKGFESMSRILFLNMNLLIKKKFTSHIMKDFIFDFLNKVIMKCKIDYIDETKVLEIVKEFVKSYKDNFNYSISLYEIQQIYIILDHLCEIKFTNIISEIKEYISILYGLSDFLKDINEIAINELKKNLHSIPFDKEKLTIGIYGIGTHTNQLINFYTKYIGQIKAKILFIDSYKQSFSEKFLNKDIINVSDILKYDINSIVICSVSYEESMIANLSSNNYKKHIYTFYNKYKSNIFVLDGNDLSGFLQ